MDKKKKENIKTIVIVALVLIIVLGGSFLLSEVSSKTGSYDKNNTAQESIEDEIETEDIPEEEQGELTSIRIDDYLELKKQEEKSIILIARPTCHYCQMFDPIIKNVVYLYGIQVNYLNTDELSTEEQTKLIESDDFFKDGYGTPLTLIVQNNKIVDQINGYTTKENTIQFFKDNGIISE